MSIVRGACRQKTVDRPIQPGQAVLLVASLGEGAVYAAETGFKISIDPDTVRASDIAFVSTERVEAVEDVEGYWPGPPDLVVEVISPNDNYGEVEEKVYDWLVAGVRMVIIINPGNRIVTVYRSFTNIGILTGHERCTARPRS
ncbi:MAG: Uma2 family endonuclease [Methylococcales bacterium]